MFRRTLAALLIPCVASIAHGQATRQFSGDWKLDPSRSTLTDRFTVDSDGGNRYTFDFGGGPETIVVDGTDQPTPLLARGTLSVSREGDAWKVVRKLEGRTTLTATWRLSADSSLLTDHFTSTNADGSPYQLNYVYERKSAGAGFAGTWVSRSLEAVNYVIELQIRPYADHGLAFLDSTAQFTGNMQFADSLVRQTGDRTVRLMVRRKGGNIADFVSLSLSSDLRTLTMTPLDAPASEAHIFVFDRLRAP